MWYEGGSNTKYCQNQYCIRTNLQFFPALFAEQSINFCGECIKLYENKQFCYFCAQVYQENQSDFLDGKIWLECDVSNCHRWMHLECEMNNGIDDIEQLIKDDKYKYLCPWCRQKNRKSKRAKKLEKQKEKKSLPMKTIEQEVKKVVRESSTDRVQPNSSLNDLLQKYGGQVQQVALEDIQKDLSMMRSLQTK